MLTRPVARALRFAAARRCYLRPTDDYAPRHNGSTGAKVSEMLDLVGTPDMKAFVRSVVPDTVLVERPLQIEPQAGFTESQLSARVLELGNQNHYWMRSFIGQGYFGTVVPPVIARNVLECPQWYTSYTPYQPEISQGRLESLLNFQTMIADLTGMDVANASLLDEATAAGEVMSMAKAAKKLPAGVKGKYLVDRSVYSQTVEVLKSRASTLNAEIVVCDLGEVKDIDASVFGAVAQYPAKDGSLTDWTSVGAHLKAQKISFGLATDLLALTMFKEPAQFSAEAVFGSSQRFGVPMGYGGPHAAFLAVRNEHVRRLPGRLIGVSKDRLGSRALRLSLQTREQHIKRERATSNICTAQALLANMAAMYAVYHGPAGLRAIAERIHKATSILAAALGDRVLNQNWFDTLSVQVDNASALLATAESSGINLFKVSDTVVSLSLDETVTEKDLETLASVFGVFIGSTDPASLSPTLARTTPYLTHAVFNSHHSETEMLRYLNKLQRKDLSLADSMIPLGSCTMKLNATTTMLPVSMPQFANVHPFAPHHQTKGYRELLLELETDLADITGFDAVSLQPNSGAQGEYTGLRVIKAYFEAQGQAHRNVCLIPVSAHGTNPASAVMSGFKVVTVKCTGSGELDLEDLRAKAEKHSDNLAATMITYPSTFGVFERGIREAIAIVHSHGGQVYMDGANMNAQIGLTSPGDLGADVCHLNLHKTFCIPHGGGGPGAGPIGVRSHLVAYLPNSGTGVYDDLADSSRVPTIKSASAIQNVSAAPFGSALILPISWAYIKMMGNGLKHASELALLNANYMKTRLQAHYPILYANQDGRCAHEFIVDARQFKASAGIEVIDIAKRLQDYGFHGPTMSWPVPNTLMIEPTESESKAELDRFCDALIAIRKEIADIESGLVPRENNVLKNAPHPQHDLVVSDWDRPYTREQAAYPLPYLRDSKFWPSVGRLDDTYGDTNLFCSCFVEEA